MALTLREALRCLCSSKTWIYAVFWKLRTHDRMILTWEDGYYEHAQFCSNGPLISATDSIDPDQIFMIEMSQEIHLLGQGIIGNVAVTGQHKWFFQENYLGGISPCGNEIPRSWKNQFAAGLQTIATIAVAPYGVIQLGSKQTMMENIDLVRRVKTLFGNLQRAVGVLSSDSRSLSSTKRISGQTSDIRSRAELLSLIGSQQKAPITKCHDQLEVPSLSSAQKAGIPGQELVLPFGTTTFTPNLTTNQLTSLQSSGMHSDGVNSNGVSCNQISIDSNGLLIPQRQAKEIRSHGQMVDDNLGNFQNVIQRNVSDANVVPLSYNHTAFGVDNHDRSLHDSSDILMDNESRMTSGVFDSKFSRPTILQNAFSEFQNAAAQLQHVQNNPLVEVNNSHGSVSGVNISNKVSSFSTENINIPISDNARPSQTAWQVMPGQLETAALEAQTNNLPLSQVSGILGMEPVVWDKGMAKDLSSLFQDTSVEGTNVPKENGKGLDVAMGDVLHGVNDYDPNGLHDFELYLNCLVKGQESPSNLQVLTNSGFSDVSGTACSKGQTPMDFQNTYLPAANAFNGHPAANTCNGGFSSTSSFANSLPSFSQVSTINNMLEGSFTSEKKSEHLLDAMIANLQQPAENSSSKISGSMLNCGPSKLSSSMNSDSLMFGSNAKFVNASHGLVNTDKRNIQNCSVLQQFDEERYVKRLFQENSLSNQLTSWVEDNNSKCENQASAQLRKPEEQGKVNRKRAKPGESTRPRPKDRQQIQDRVKELREIVPNGNKCSIDALLERTIKHMLFLQSVTKHAEKLNQTCDTKTIAKEGSVITKSSISGGASWALELGSQKMECPIIVENLSQPRQLLVEMLCEERGLFLEIADIIRRLGLTILKGVMEARTEKIWARFIVEANRDVHRVDILWSLMQLLQQNNKSNSSQQTSQPSVVTHQSKDTGSQAFSSSFQSNCMPIPISMAERIR